MQLLSQIQRKLAVQLPYSSQGNRSEIARAKNAPESNHLIMKRDALANTEIYIVF